MSRTNVDKPEKELKLTVENQKLFDIHKIFKKDGDKLVLTAAAIVTFEKTKNKSKLEISEC